MRITIVGPGKRFLGGISYYTISLANALAQHHDVSVLFLRDLLPKRLFPGKDHVGQPISPLQLAHGIPAHDGLDWHWGASAIRAGTFLAAQRPDVLVLQWWTSAVTHSYLLLRAVNRLAVGARTIVEFHEVLDPLEMTIAPLRLYVHGAKRAMFRNIDAYVTHSKSDLDEVTKAYGLDRQTGFVVSHGSYDHFRRNGARPNGGGDDSQTNRRTENSAPYTILYFGLIRPYKGVEYLIRAFDALPVGIAERCQLVIVGETWEGHTLPAELIARSPYRDRIEFVNRYVTDDEVHGLFDRADLACFPYLRASQSGAAHIAVSYGIPVLASRVGGLAESLDEYAGTLFCRPADVGDIRDNLIRAVLGGRQRGFADPFPWQRTAREYQTVLDLVAADRLAITRGQSARSSDDVTTVRR